MEKNGIACCLANQNVAWCFDEFSGLHFFLLKFVGNVPRLLLHLWIFLLMLYTTILKSVVGT